ncbi:VanZ family protein [Georgenia deserti]|uniref:VanZ family protein n=1 Tax=Georgenia deserti TaxID=2093781 RepID=A0ABW4KZJ3_9MICO
MPLSPARTMRWCVLAAALVVQFAVLYLPQTPGPEVTIPGADKAVHLAVFALVTVAGLAAGLRRALVVGYGLGHAVLSEIVQHLVLADRTGDVFDAVADAAGVLLVTAVVSVWRSRSAGGRTGPGRSTRR